VVSNALCFAFPLRSSVTPLEVCAVIENPTDHSAICVGSTRTQPWSSACAFLQCPVYLEPGFRTVLRQVSRMAQQETPTVLRPLSPYRMTYHSSKQSLRVPLCRSLDTRNDGNRSHSDVSRVMRQASGDAVAV
jgi:hypothetical protein